MKRTKNSLMPIIMLFIYCSIYAASNTGIKNVKTDLCTKCIYMDIPTPFHLQKQRYEEGILYCYSFSDKSYILLLEGGLLHFDMDYYKEDSRITINDRKIYKGRKDSTCWRKDVIGNVRIYYGNVKLEKQKEYDRIMDSLKLCSVLSCDTIIK